MIWRPGDGGCSPEGKVQVVEAVEIIDTITITEDAEGNVDAVETIEVIEADANPEGA